MISYREEVVSPDSVIVWATGDNIKTKISVNAKTYQGKIVIFKKMTIKDCTIVVSSNSTFGPVVFDGCLLENVTIKSIGADSSAIICGANSIFRRCKFFPKSTVTPAWSPTALIGVSVSSTQQNEPGDKRPPIFSDCEFGRKVNFTSVGSSSSWTQQAQYSSIQSHPFREAVEYIENRMKPISSKDVQRHASYSDRKRVLHLDSASAAFGRGLIESSTQRISMIIDSCVFLSGVEGLPSSHSLLGENIGISSRKFAASGQSKASFVVNATMFIWHVSRNPRNENEHIVSVRVYASVENVIFTGSSTKSNFSDQDAYPYYGASSSEFASNSQTTLFQAFIKTEKGTATISKIEINNGSGGKIATSNPVIYPNDRITSAHIIKSTKEMRDNKHTGVWERKGFFRPTYYKIFTRTSELVNDKYDLFSAEQRYIIESDVRRLVSRWIEKNNHRM